MPQVHLPQTYKRKYGLDWPVAMPDFQVELYCAKHWEESHCLSGSLKSPDLHMIEAIRLLFTPEQFKMNRWSEMMIYEWCTRNFITVLGAGATGKSNTFGFLALLDFITDPRDTVIILVSTTRQMLEVRSYEAVMRGFNYLQQKGDFGVVLNRQRMAVLNKDEEGIASTEVKAAIRGVAVKQGSVEESRNNLIGAHLPYVRLILDEMQSCRPSAVDARFNLALGARNFKFVGMGNPDSQFDLLCQYSKPKDPRGWAAVSPDDERWESEYGITLHLDGHQSPAVTEENGAEVYPFLVKQRDIDEALRQARGNQDSPSYWQMIRGWPAPQGLKNTVLTGSAVRKYRIQENAIWSGPYTTYAALDPSFTAGGDNCVLQIFRVGYFDSGMTGIFFEPPLYIPIEASSDLPVQYQIAEKVERYGYQYGFMPNRMVVDETGTQRVSDVIEMQWAPGITRFVGSVRPTELPISAKDQTPANKRYKNHITEAWFTLVEFATYDQIRGIGDEAARQFTTREIVSGPTVSVEAKDVYKARIHHSPDEADAVAMAVQFAREKLGLTPGASVQGNLASNAMAFGGMNNAFSVEKARELDLDSRDNSYLVNDL
jgi:hypothetical protein